MNTIRFHRFTRSPGSPGTSAGAKLCLLVVWLTAQGVWAAPPPVQPTLPAVDQNADEFYARVDRINSATELTVTVLDLWQPLDKVKGPRWPGGKAKVQPAERIVTLEDTSVPANPQDQKAARDCLAEALKQSNNEVICTGSAVSVRREAGKPVVAVTAYVYVKEGFTLNNRLVRLGLATTTNPFYKAWQDKAKQKRLGLWKNAKPDAGSPPAKAAAVPGQ